MNKKHLKPNRYKAAPGHSEVVTPDPGFDVDFCLKCIMVVAILCIISLACIFVHDLVTQSNAFVIKKIEFSGNKRSSSASLLKAAELDGNKNIFQVNVFTIEKKLLEQPWIKSVTVKRDLPSRLFINIEEHEPLAIVRIENISDILINTKGRPFKEYDPNNDNIEGLPVITGIDLTQRQDQYVFDGPVFNSTMMLLKTRNIEPIKTIEGDKNLGLTIKTKDIYNNSSLEDNATMTIKVGFNKFKAKLEKAKMLSNYIEKNFPDRIICSIDLSDIEKVFIRTQSYSALHNTLKKGV